MTSLITPPKGDLITPPKGDLITPPKGEKYNGRPAD
tara:strand:- start:270 stop:377 length:108 start_codon:yes stop_codon:yes gene_type:complete